MQASSSRQPIIIAGAGPAGLYTALLLVEAGCPVRVLERNDGLAKDMRASTFHPATLDLLDARSLALPLIGFGSTAQGWQYMVHGTKHHAVFDLEAISDLTRFPYRLQCEQFHLTNLLLDRLEDSRLFEIAFGEELLDIESVENEVVVHSRGAGGERVRRTPWLIAADGVNSTVRTQLRLPFEGNVLPKTSVTLVVAYPFQEEVPGLLGVNYVWTDSGHYSLLQIRDLWRVSYSPDAGQTPEEALSEAEAQRRLHTLFPSDRSYTIRHRNHYTLQQRCLDSFRAGRVLFVGDAAHVSSPAGGMGMNSGLHDAQCLAEHLVPVLAGSDEALLDRYSRRRRTVALEEVQRLAARNYRWHWETDPSRREAIWSELKSIVQDPGRMREFLLESSMIRSRQREQEID